jgi:hypothetical protein
MQCTGYALKRNGSTTKLGDIIYVETIAQLAKTEFSLKCPLNTRYKSCKIDEKT